MCVRLMGSPVFWPGLSVCQGCFMSLSWCCYYTEECQFTFLECHFITFISMLLSPCQTSPGSVQFKFPLRHKSHKLKCRHFFLCVCFCFSLSCVSENYTQYILRVIGREYVLVCCCRKIHELKKGNNRKGWTTKVHIK